MQKVKTGSFAHTTNADTSVNIGFVPQYFKMTADAGLMYEYHESYGSGKALKTAADGTRTAIASDGISTMDGANGKGVTIEGDSSNIATDTYYYVAFL